MLTLSNIALPDFSYTDPVWLEFYDIFRKTLNPDLTMREFKFFYFFKDPQKMDLSFIYEDEELIGFICASFYYYSFSFSKKQYTIARGTTGVLPGHRGGKVPSFKLCTKYIRYKISHPFEEIYITGYMASPKIYAMMCKYAHRVYPKTGITEPPFIKRLRDEILGSKHRMGEYLVKLHFKVTISSADINVLLQSQNKHIRKFLEINPNFRDETGLFTIIPLDWGNVGASMLAGLFAKPAARWKNKITMQWQPVKA